MSAARRLAFALLLVHASYCAAGDDSISTVGSITRNNGLTSNGHLIVKSPSILRIAPSRPVPADPRLAIAQYDRLLELSSDPDIRAEALRRSADLRVQLADTDASTDTDTAGLKIAIDRYRQLLAELPDYERNDRVLYQLSRAYQLAGDTDQAIDALRQLARRFPASMRFADAAFRAGEWLYARGRYDEAEPQYRAVVDLGSSGTFYDAAQYKYGWSLYKQNQYERALPVFLAMLDRYLPPGALTDPASALAAVARNKLQYTSDALRVSCLSFAAIGGGKAANDYFAEAGSEPRYVALLYSALGNLLLEKNRYTDAAETFIAFIARHPNHALAPDFQMRAIAAYQDGGFGDLVVAAKQGYVEHYAPGTPYWGTATPPAVVMAELRKDLDDLGRHYQAKAQQTPQADGDARKAGFSAAAGWYRRNLELFPDAPQAADTRLLYADALYDGGQTRAAAEQYSLAAYADTHSAKAPEAAYAAVQAYQRLSQEAPATVQGDALRLSIDASLKLAERFPQHPQLPLVLTRAAGDLYAIKDYERAVAVAGRALQLSPPLAAELRRDALAAVADSRFAQQQYPQAESAYIDLLKLLPPADSRYHPALEQLAASVYKQAESARNAGDLRSAAASFQRVGRVAPGASILANADYDAAAAYMNLRDWPSAVSTLESFRQRFPTHALIAEADKKLAVAYQESNILGPAAAVYARIAQREVETTATRRDAAWLSARLYDQSGTTALAARSYAAYIGAYPLPLDRSMQARRRLADLALADGHDDAHYLYWLRELVATDNGAGAARSEASKLMAAQACLELGRYDAAKAREATLTMPVNKSLPRRKSAIESAIASLDRAAGYGYAEVTTAATYEIGMVYRDFGRALVTSQRPTNLNGDALEQYNILLEEQAEPFDEKAIAAHEANLQRLRQGLWNDWIRKSAVALADLAPAKYGKHEQRESSYDQLH